MEKIRFFEKLIIIPEAHWFFAAGWHTRFSILHSAGF